MSTEDWAAFWAYHEPAPIYAGPKLFCMGDREPWPCRAAVTEVPTKEPWDRHT